MPDPAPLSKRPARTDDLERELELLRRQLDQAFDDLERRLADAEARAGVAEARAGVAEARASVAETRAADAEGRAEEAHHRVDELVALITGAPVPARATLTELPDAADEDGEAEEADEDAFPPTGDEPGEDLRDALQRLRNRLETRAPEPTGDRQT